MITRKLFLLTLIWLPFLSALANENEATRVKATIEGRYQEWLAAENSKDVAALTNLYDEDAVLMPKAEEPLIGRTAIGEFYKKQVVDPHFVPFTLQLDWNSFHLVNDIAIMTAVFDGGLTRNEKQIHFRGKHLLVWKKEADGSWKIFRYMYDEIPVKS